MSLPPLPEAGFTRPGYIYNADNEICGHALPILYYTADQLREYGQQCRAAALEEAAKFIENGSFLHDQSPAKLFADQLAPKIRGLK